MLEFNIVLSDFYCIYIFYSKKIIVCLNVKI